MTDDEFCALLPRCDACGELIAVDAAVAGEVVQATWMDGTVHVHRDQMFHAACRPDLKPGTTTIKGPR